MAGSKADAFENAVLNIATGQASGLTGLSGTITPYLALFTGTLTGDTAGTEATGGGYARVSTAGKWATPSGGSVANNAAITFPTFTGSVSLGAAITHFGLFDAATGGTALYYGDLTDQTKTFGNNDVLSFPSGTLTLTEG
jgi:hypothetical protein